MWVRVVNNLHSDFKQARVKPSSLMGGTFEPLSLSHFFPRLRHMATSLKIQQSPISFTAQFMKRIITEQRCTSTSPKAFLILTSGQR